MKGNRLEAEVIVRLDAQDRTAHICVSNWPAMARKMERRYGRSKDGNIETAGSSMRWTVPYRVISFRSLKKD